MGRTLGIVTIGQTPRDDIAALLGRHAPAGTRRADLAGAITATGRVLREMLE